MSGDDRPGGRKRSRRRRFLLPLVVTVVVLAAAVVGSFLWTAHYIDAATSGLQTKPSPRAADPTGKGGLAADQATLLAQVHGAVWAVNTLDGNGNPSVGSAFAVVSTPSQTLLLTSYAVVAAATYQTAPPVQVRQGDGADQVVTLRTWDSAHDLALLVMNKGNEPVLHGTNGILAVLGQKVYEVTGVGGPTGAITAGKLTTVAAGKLETDTPQADAPRGAPLIDTSGDVLGLVSFANGAPSPSPAASPAAPAAHATVPIGDACRQVLVCPGGTFP